MNKPDRTAEPDQRFAVRFEPVKKISLIGQEESLVGQEESLVGQEESLVGKEESGPGPGPGRFGGVYNDEI